MNTLASSKPWYREPWPWLLAIMPAVAVMGGIITAWLAISSNDGLVVDDYYKQGKAINQTKARDRQAQVLGLVARLQPRDGVVRLTLAGRLDTPPGKLKLTLLHPTRSGDDHEIVLDWDGMSYTGALPALTGGHYRLELSPEFGNWRLTGEYRPGEALTLEPHA